MIAFSRSVLFAVAAVISMPLCSSRADDLIAPIPNLSDSKIAKFLCPKGNLDPGKLLATIYYNNPTTLGDAFPEGPASLKDALSTDAQTTDIQNNLARQVAAQFAVLLKSSKALTPTDTTSTPEQILSGQARLVLTCVALLHPPASPAQPPAAPSPNQTQTVLTSGEVRVRGTPSDLSIAQKLPTFSGASSSTLSFSQNGPTKTTSNVMQVAVGYAIPIVSLSKFSTWEVAATPFAAVDRSFTDVSGKASSSNRENVMTGILSSAITPPFSIGSSGFNDAIVSMSGMYEHVWDNINDSGLHFVQMLAQPVFLGMVNDQLDPIVRLQSFPAKITPQLIFDVRADVGSYDDHGLKPATTRDYQQFGTEIGLLLSFNFTDYFKPSFTITETFLGQASNSRKDISLFTSSVNYPIYQKIVGIQASYQNGNSETTAQRIEQWLISLSVKY